MQKNVFVILGIFSLVHFFSPGSIRAVDKSTSLQIDKEIQNHREEIIKIRRFIHMNPELGNREYETSRLVASKLLSLGLDVKTAVAKTGVVALLQGQNHGFTVGIRADMDALPIQELTNVPYKSLNPGIMHACGHDVHTSIVLGTAMVLSSMREKINGNIKFIFQPAEEGTPNDEEGGARLMIQEGVLEDPPVGAIFGLHVWPETLGRVVFSPGTIMASADGFQIIIKGKSAHGARPQEGIDAINIASQVVVALQAVTSRTIDPLNPVVISIGKIHGGKAANIIADEVQFEGTVRTLNESTRAKIARSMEDIVRGITQAFGATYVFNYKRGLPPVYNHPELAKIMRVTLPHAVGENNVISLVPQMVSEDFAFYGQKIPGFFFFLGVKDPLQKSMPPLHNPYFNPDERSISLGIKIMCQLLLDCLEHQSRLNETTP